MDITINVSNIIEFLNQDPTHILGFLFLHGGWIVVILVVLAGLFYLRLYFKRKKYIESIKYNLLAIDIPKDNEQSLVAVEQIFATLAGIRSSGNLVDQYWIGQTQLTFSLEIISLEGYIQFLVRTPEQYRDLVEAALYAQYPEAEITEVDDYVSLIPDDVHEVNSDYKLWGTELSFAKHSCYPIKTYKLFEHPLTQQFIDPMASLLEIMSKLGPGEQFGMQIIIAPVDDGWKEKGKEIVKVLIGEKSTAPDHLGDKLVKFSMKGLEKASEGIYKMWGDIKDETEDDKASQNLYQYLTENEKFVVTQIQNKLAKISFATTFRIYYLAYTDRFQKGKGIYAILGAINQFNSSDLNAFKKHKLLTTTADYVFVKSRLSRKEKKITKLYKERSREGSDEFFLNTEELATLYHFPTITVKAPLLSKTEAKKAEPPIALPLETSSGRGLFQHLSDKSIQSQPQNIYVDKTQDLEIPIVDTELKYKDEDKITSSLPGYNFDNDYYENRFAKNKKTIKTPDKPIEKKEQPPSNLPFTE